MKYTGRTMGMPVTIEILDRHVHSRDLEDIRSFFHCIDARFSTYKTESEIEQINRGERGEALYSNEMQEILSRCRVTEQETGGYFSAWRHGRIDPSGIVKGYALWRAGQRLREKGFTSFRLDIGGDMELAGTNNAGRPWHVGIQHPFSHAKTIKILSLSNCGIATSGITLQGQHIHNPLSEHLQRDIVSVTVIAPNAYEADRFATPVFAMGLAGLPFLESRPGCEGYMVTFDAHAYATSGFSHYIARENTL